MNNLNYTYNNEAIGLIAIYTILKEKNSLNIAKISLILPILFHEKTLIFLCKNENITLKSFSEKIFLLENLNDRFIIFLPITTNIITILCSSKLAKIENNIIHLATEKKLDINNQAIGERALSLIKGANNLANLLNEDVIDLYSQLKILL